MLKKILLLSLILQLIIAPVSLFATDHNALRKAARGLVNVSGCWMEIPRQMIKVKEAEGDLAGISWGMAKGFTFLIGRALVGVYEIATFIIPKYKPLVEPEFIIDLED
ncbi:MAG: exosortase system-associated protein, TIGR04073 family [Candidatus Omnitrophota bacterium]|nr:MAG: exosortase system-associated protein, TIGR04073 family [Candidatus Omnitrophota bacterium]